jgi:hypothetical protein
MLKKALIDGQKTGFFNELVGLLRPISKKSGCVK